MKYVNLFLSMFVHNCLIHSDLEISECQLFENKTYKVDEVFVSQEDSCAICECQYDGQVRCFVHLKCYELDCVNKSNLQLECCHELRCIGNQYNKRNSKCEQ